MKKTLCLFILLLCPSGFSHGQQVTDICNSADHQTIDFWLGSWDLTWQDATGTHTGTNTISKTYNGCVIEENFKSEALKGMSISSYDNNSKGWRQIWVDNQNSFLDLFGQKNKDNYIFQTLPNPDKPNAAQRMVFSDIKKNSLIWTWQGSKDGGDHWNDLWKIIMNNGLPDI